ncbi:MAG: hypothetical protein ACPGMR_05800 [Pontibacterium sp.]
MRRFRPCHRALSGLLMLATLAWSPISSAQEGKSLIENIKQNGAVEGVVNALGVVADTTQKIVGLKGVPERIAVLPATGQGEESERQDISNALHNILGTSRYTLLKPHQVEFGIQRAEVTENKPFAQISDEALATALGVDGLLHVNVDTIDKVYAAAYAHYEIEVSVSLYSKQAKKIIWQHKESIIEREGGVSLNPLGIIATAVTSASLLSEATRLQLIDQLARQFADVIPEPAGAQRIQPPAIALALSNNADGPFRTGDEITVLMEAEQGLVASFSLGAISNIALNEQTPGNYSGRYVVKAGENWDDAVIEISATRPSDKANTLWRLSGRVAVDTVAPPELSSLTGYAIPGGIQLSWNNDTDAGTEIGYHIERADILIGEYESIATASINSFVDKNTQIGHTYVYRVRPIDQAGNKAAAKTTTVSVVKPGPTQVASVINTPTVWSALGSPYLVNGKVTIEPSAQLRVEPGTRIEIADNSLIKVLGKVQLLGSPDANITFDGNNYALSVENTPVQSEAWRHLRFNGSGNQLTVENADLSIENANSNGVTFTAGRNGHLRLEQATVTNSGTAVSLTGGRITLNNTEIRRSSVGIDVVSSDAEQPITAVQSRLSQNDIHIRSAVPVSVANIEITSDSYQEAMAKMSGPVSIDWQSLGAEKNLQLPWLIQRWETINPLLESKNWDKAHQELAKLNTQEEHPLQVVISWLSSGTLPATAPSTPFLSKVYKAIQSNSNLGIYVQPLQVPNKSALLSSTPVVLKQASSRFTKSFLNDKFAAQKREKAFQTALGSPLNDSLIGSDIGYKNNQGLTSQIWVVQVYDDDLMTHLLSSAGLVQRQRANFVVAFAASGGGDDILKREVFAALDQQNIPFIDLSNTPPAQWHSQAKAKGAALMINARLATSSSTSTLTKNLEVISTSLNIKFESTHSGEVLGSLNKRASASTFKNSGGTDRVVTEAFTGVSERFTNDIYRLEKQAAGPR